MAQVKLIAEPWDVGQGDSYDVGRFPAGWSEWNGKFRDTVRDFWRSHDGLLPDLATRLTGSPDLYTRHRRGPDASINLITVHDGFTLADLVSYNDKHNEANTEHNRDGTSDNRSWNCGVEGPTDDPAIIELRAAAAPGDAVHPAAGQGSAAAARRRRGRPHPAGQQQRLLPGQRDRLVGLVFDRHRAARLHRQPDRAAAPAPGAAPPALPDRAGGDPLVHPVRCADDARRLGGRRRQERRDGAVRIGAIPTSATTARRRSTTTWRC